MFFFSVGFTNVFLPTKMVGFSLANGWPFFFFRANGVGSLVLGKFSKILSCSLLGFAFIFKKYSVVAYSVLALFSKNTRLIMLGYEIFSKNTRFEMVGYTIFLKKWSVTRWSVRPCF